MSSSNVFGKLFKTWASISKMAVDGTRKPEDVLRFIQRIVDDSDFIKVLDRSEQVPANFIPANGWQVDWQCFYKEVFNLTVDFSDVEIPAEQPGFGWVVILAHGLALNEAWDKCWERFPSTAYTGDDLERMVPINDRTTTVAYAKRFRDRVEADEENSCLSANDLARREIRSITLLERILLELWFNWRSGGHLDMKNETLCAGSRWSSGGSVPRVSCSKDGGFEVHSCRLDDALSNLRSRSAI